MCCCLHPSERGDCIHHKVVHLAAVARAIVGLQAIAAGVDANVVAHVVLGDPACPTKPSIPARCSQKCRHLNGEHHLRSLQVQGAAQPPGQLAVQPQTCNGPLTRSGHASYHDERPGPGETGDLFNRQHARVTRPPCTKARTRWARRCCPASCRRCTGTPCPRSATASGGRTC